MSELIEIDGTMAEGGGQILRGALALAGATGRPFRVVGARANRPKPGLMRQHLTAIRAVAQVCAAEVEGAALGSTTIEVRPGTVRGGDYVIDIGSAGSVPLVLQALVPPLARAGVVSRVVITGGTHNPMAPPFEFLAQALAPQLAAIGWAVELALVRPGFAPAGGGRVEAVIGPAAAARPLALVERGPRVRQEVRAVVANLARSIAERELARAIRRLNWAPTDGHALTVSDVDGTGNYVAITLGHAHVTEVVTALGAPRRPAEAVADAAVELAHAYTRARAPVSEHLCDQLLVPLALTAGGVLRATTWSAHAEAQRLLLRRWFGCDVDVDRDEDGVTVRVPAMA